MKKTPILVLGSGLLILSGCWRKTKRTPHNGTELAGTVVENQGSRIFDTDENAFVLEENGQSPFEPDTTVKLVDDASLWHQEDKRFDTIYFDYDRHAIRSDQQGALQAVAREIKVAMKEHPEAVFQVEGHACKAGGSEVHNWQLSDDRARTVRDALVKLSVPADRLKVVGRGTTMLKVQVPESASQELLKAQQAPNRRVEIHMMMRSK